MLPTLLLGGALALGQPPADPPVPTPDPPPSPVELTAGLPPAVPPGPAALAPAPVVYRYAFQRATQGTWLGVLLDDSRTVVNGWTQMSYTASTARNSNLPVTLNDRPREFLMNQTYLHVERTVDTTKREYQWGFLVDQLVGTDYRYTLPRGLFNGQLTSNDGRPELYGYDPFQFFLQAFLPDLGPRGTKVIVGRFATNEGYELVQAADNPFLSRSYEFQYNPFTHTGVWAISQLTDDWLVGNGFVTGADTFIDPAAQLTYLSQVKWAPPTGRTSVALNNMITRPRTDAAEGFVFFNEYDLLVTHKLTDRLAYVLDATYSHSRAADGTYADWYGAAQYLTYTVSPSLLALGRLEFFNDTVGFRTGGEGLYTAVTAGLAWRPTADLLVRPSVRYDRNNQSRPFDGRPDLFTAAMDLIVRW